MLQLTNSGKEFLRPRDLISQSCLITVDSFNNIPQLISES